MRPKILETLVVINKFVNGPHGPVEVRFLRMEQYVTDIHHNVNPLMESKRYKFGIL